MVLNFNHTIIKLNLFILKRFFYFIKVQLFRQNLLFNHLNKFLQFIFKNIFEYEIEYILQTTLFEVL